MIRRGFWLTTGAVTGIIAYRRVSAVGRRVSASLAPTASLTSAPGQASVPGRPSAAAARRNPPRPPLITVRGTSRQTLRAVREAYRFTRDVREGMEIYRLAHSEPAGSTLSEGSNAFSDGSSRTERSSRPRAANRELAPNHDLRTEDGH